VVSDRTRGLFVIAGPFLPTPGDEDPGVLAGEGAAPDAFEVAVAPNPFTTRARLTLSTPTAQHVRVTLYDALGRALATPFEGALAAGAPRTVEVDGSRLAPGTYFLRVEGEDFATTRPLVRAR
jgi:hypothetical protein